LFWFILCTGLHKTLKNLFLKLLDRILYPSHTRDDSQENYLKRNAVISRVKQQEKFTKETQEVIRQREEKLREEKLKEQQKLLLQTQGHTLKK